MTEITAGFVRTWRTEILCVTLKMPYVHRKTLNVRLQPVIMKTPSAPYMAFMRGMPIKPTFGKTIAIMFEECLCFCNSVFGWLNAVAIITKIICANRKNKITEASCINLPRSNLISKACIITHGMIRNSNKLLKYFCSTSPHFFAFAKKKPPIAIIDIVISCRKTIKYMMIFYRLVGFFTIRYNDVSV